MSSNRIIVFFLLLFVTLSSYAGDFYVTPGIGRGEIKVKPEYSFSGQKQTNNNFGLGAAVGYEFDSNVLVESHFYRSETDSIFSAFDSYRFSQTRFLIGYAFDVNLKFRIIPKIGYSQWDLDGEEGMFLNPGDEERSSIDGNTSFAQIDFEFPIRDWFSINTSYTNTNFDFGKVQTIHAGVKFKF
jgi:hypothetical protein